MASPAKKRNTERCSRVDNPSKIGVIGVTSTPLRKNACIRARFSGLHSVGQVTVIYLRPHCCINMANMALIRLLTRLKNQKELTQMEYLGGENGGGLEIGEGMGVRDAFGSTRT
jgi:hypothetical protein